MNRWPMCLFAPRFSLCQYSVTIAGIASAALLWPKGGGALFFAGVMLIGCAVELIVTAGKGD